MAEKIAIPYDRLSKNQTLHKIITKKVADVKSKSVVLEDGTEIPFAYCVFATGKRWFASNECALVLCLSVLRADVLSVNSIPDFRAEAIEAMKVYRDRVAAAFNIVVIGGGAVGVEMAGEIACSL